MASNSVFRAYIQRILTFLCIILIPNLAVIGCTHYAYNVPEDQWNNMNTELQQDAIRQYFKGKSIIVGQLQALSSKPFTLDSLKINREGQPCIGSSLIHWYMGRSCPNEKSIKENGFFFVQVPTGNWFLCSDKPHMAFFRDSDTLLNFDVPEGKILNLGAFKLVIHDTSIVRPSPYGDVHIYIYAWQHVDDESAITVFQQNFPEVYDVYKENVIKIK